RRRYRRQTFRLCHMSEDAHSSSWPEDPSSWHRQIASVLHAMYLHNRPTRRSHRTHSYQPRFQRELNCSNQRVNIGPTASCEKREIAYFLICLRSRILDSSTALTPCAKVRKRLPLAGATVSVKAPQSDATTGQPASMASIATPPNGSM